MTDISPDAEAMPRQNLTASKSSPTVKAREKKLTAITKKQALAMKRLRIANSGG